MIIEKKNCILIQSEMNNWINICIIVQKEKELDDILHVSSEAYNEWFESDTDETITEHVEKKLNEKNFDFKVFTGPFNEDEEDLL